MKNALFWGILMAWPFWLGAQVEFEYVEWSATEWQSDRQVRYWEDGTVRLKNDYEGLELYRYQYDRAGHLIFKTPIRRYEDKDTIITFDPDTFMESYTYYWHRHDYPIGRSYAYYASGQVWEQRIHQSDGRQVIMVYREDGTQDYIYHLDNYWRRIGKYWTYYPQGQLQMTGTWKAATHICQDNVPSFDPETFIERTVVVKHTIQIRGDDWRCFLPTGEPYDPATRRGDDIK